MRVKICGLKSEKDIDVIVKAGADAAGFLVGQLHASPDFILPSTAARLAAKLPPYIVPVLVTQLTEAEEILELVSKSGINTIQLHGHISLKEVKILRSSLPASGKIIMAVSLCNDKLRSKLDEYYSSIDAILLDSCNLVTGDMGGTGLTHDWNVSADFVKECSMPVILAGGLSPDNVDTAIKKVNPFAIDANSSLKNSKGERDLTSCCKFVQRARNTVKN